MDSPSTWCAARPPLPLDSLLLQLMPLLPLPLEPVQVPLELTLWLAWPV